ncbi:hypothetical protein [Methanobrevibacter arboriphilus]|nr:hypothetical protein [Methanobrevibacter arboriphilus]
MNVELYINTLFMLSSMRIAPPAPPSPPGSTLLFAAILLSKIES